MTPPRGGTLSPATRTGFPAVTAAVFVAWHRECHAILVVPLGESDRELVAHAGVRNDKVG
jgi:hypothetical protein